MAAGCPSDSELRQYLAEDGVLDQARIEQISSHLELCNPCSNRLGDVSDELLNVLPETYRESLKAIGALPPLARIDQAVFGRDLGTLDPGDREIAHDKEAQSDLDAAVGDPPAGMGIFGANPSWILPKSTGERPDDRLGAADEPAALSIGTKIGYFGDYELLEKIGSGGMGVVYKARQIKLNRTVAVKMILRGALADEDDIRRFNLEAEAVASLDHPAIVPIFEVGQHEGHHYFSMGFVEGESLKQRLSGGPLVPCEAAKLIMKVAEGIAYAHQRGVIHRDLKPANILLDQNGNPRVTDFGLAKKVHGDSSLTESDQIVGTPSYMPPEQAAGKRGELSPAADIYSLGATLYALLAGRPPFLAATTLDTVLMVRTVEPVPPRRMNASIPRDLETICLKCLEKDPKKRYGSAGELAADILRYLQNVPIVARPVSFRERAVKWALRRPAIAALSGALLATVVLGSVTIAWKSNEAIVSSEEANKARVELRDASVEFSRQKQDEQSDRAEKAAQATRLSTNLALIQCSEGQTDRGLLRLANGLATATPAEFQRLLRLNLDAFSRRFHPPAPPPAEFGEIMALAYSSDGRRVAVSGKDNLTRTLDVETGRQVCMPMTHEEPVTIVALNVDGSRLVTATKKSARLWDVAKGQPIGGPLTHPTAVHQVVFSPDGKRFATVASPGGARLWDASTGSFVRSQSADILGSLMVAFSPDGTRLATGDFEYLRLWDAQTGKVVGQPITYRFNSKSFFLRSMAFSPDGKHLAAGHAALDLDLSSEARVWDLRTGKLAGPPLKHEGFVEQIAYSPNGQILATASSDHTVRLWDAKTYQAIGNPLKHLGGVHALAFSPDGARLATAASNNAADMPASHATTIWDIRRREPIGETIQKAAEVLTFSPDGTRLVSSGGSRSAPWVWDSTAVQPSSILLGERLPTERDRQGVRGVEAEVRAILQEQRSTLPDVLVSRDGSRILIGIGTGRFTLWDAENGLSIISHKLYTGAFDVAFSGGGARFATSANDGVPRLWDETTGRHFGPLLEPGGRPKHSALGPAGKRLAVAADGGVVRMWDFETGRLIGEPIRDEARSLIFSPDDSRLATVGTDRYVRLWDTSTSHPVGRPMRSEAEIDSVKFSPDGTRLVVIGKDSTLRFWDTTATQLIAESPRIGVDAGFFSADSRRFVTTTQEGSVKLGPGTVIFRLWDPVTGQPLGGPIERYISFGVLWPELTRDGRRFVPRDGHGPTPGYVADDGPASIWDTGARSQAGWDLKHGDEANKLGVLSPDGRLLATGGVDHAARLWRTEDGEPDGDPLLHGAPVVAIAFSPDSRLVATAGSDRLVRLWDLATRCAIGPPLPSTGSVKLRFSPDGRRVVVVYVSTGRVVLWAVPSELGGDPERIKQRSELLTNRVLKTTGDTLSDLDASELSRRADALRVHGSAPLPWGSPRNERVAWHQREAAAAEQQGDWFALLWHLDRLVEPGCRNPLLLKRRGLAHNNLGQAGQAIADYDKSLELDPENESVWHLRGNAHREAGRFAEAVADCSKALELCPGEPDYLECRGSAYLGLGEWSRAITDYDAAIQAEPDVPLHHHSLAWVLATCPEPSLRDGQRAVDHARRAGDLTKLTDAHHLATLGAALAEVQDFDAAVRYTGTALELTPESDANRAHLLALMKLFKAKKPYHQEHKSR
jgi:eukaryotic-like serine/threonine-protein kinase